MAYEYGIVSGMNEYDPIGTAHTITDAKEACNSASAEWDGTRIATWKQVKGIVMAQAGIGEYWYIRKI